LFFWLKVHFVNSIDSPNNAIILLKTDINSESSTCEIS